MPHPAIVTLDDFITGLLPALAGLGHHRFDLRDTKIDCGFEAAYRQLLACAETRRVAPNFVISPDPMHGDSATLRDALTGRAAQGRGIVFKDRSGHILETRSRWSAAPRNPLDDGFYAEAAALCAAHL